MMDDKCEIFFKASTRGHPTKYLNLGISHFLTLGYLCSVKKKSKDET